MKEKTQCKLLELSLICLILFGIAQSALAERNQPLVLRGGVLIDGTDSSQIEDAVAVILNGRIVEIGPKTKVKIPANSRVIDVIGGAILPGFINAHVHGAYDETLLQAWAQAGVTTVRDLAARPPFSSFHTRDLLNKNPLNARLVAAGPQMTAGFVPRGYKSSVFVYTVEEARAEAERILKEGADLLKIMLESNWGNRVMSEEVARAIVETAHRHGKKVSAHISLSRDIATAVNVGIDDLAHMAVDKVPNGLIKRVVDAGIYWTPTIELRKGFALIGIVPDTYLLDNLGRFAKAGGKVALGTDYGGGPFPFDLGMPMKEIQWMREAGMSPSDIIISATKNAAEACGLGGELGTLERGKIADILVIDKNPLKDLANLTKVRLVIKDGVIIRE
jgi:imidazolonepropionase-like amidohydrolase